MPYIVYPATTIASLKASNLLPSDINGPDIFEIGTKISCKYMVGLTQPLRVVSSEEFEGRAFTMKTLIALRWQTPIKVVKDCIYSKKRLIKICFVVYIKRALVQQAVLAPNRPDRPSVNSIVSVQNH